MSTWQNGPVYIPPGQSLVLCMITRFGPAWFVLRIGPMNVEVAVVFIDTVITAAGYAKAGDDNDAAAAPKVMSTLTAVSDQTGALALGLDHLGKFMATGTRGS